MAVLDRYQAGKVALLADGSVPGGVTFAFTERTGGVSEGCHASLNLGDACGDEPSRVAENRRLALAAIGAAAWAGSLVAPHQVHGDHLVRVTSAEPEELLARRREAREGADAVVCAMSGNFVQRGEPALVNKLSRAEMAVSCGADLVLELPTAWAMATAETFAKGGVQLLTMAGCTHIGFGSECGDAALLQRVADTLLSPDLQADIRLELAAGVTYAAARQKAVETRLGDAASVLRQPNDTLAVEYLKACRQLEVDITPIVVRRVGAGHDGAPSEGYASATYIRQLVRQGKGASAFSFMPEAAAAVLARELAAGRVTDSRHVERAVLARLRQMTEEEFAAYDGGGEGLYHRVYDAVRRCATVEELLAAVKTKRYAYARLRRMLLAAYLDVTAADVPPEVPYLRVLACNERGRKLLKTIKKTGSATLLTKSADVRALSEEAQKLFALTARAADQYVLAYPELRAARGSSAWTEGPVIV